MTAGPGGHVELEGPTVILLVSSPRAAGIVVLISDAERVTGSTSWPRFDSLEDARDARLPRWPECDGSADYVTPAWAR